MFSTAARRILNITDRVGFLLPIWGSLMLDLGWCKILGTTGNFLLLDGLRWWSICEVTWSVR